MDENILRLRVGIFVVIAMCILGILIFLNSEGWVTQYTVYLKPTSAPGVTPGTPIRKNGILIGRVKDVTPMDAEGFVLLELGINQNSQIYSNETGSIGSESLLGDAGIEILGLPLDQRGEPLRDEQVLNKVAIRGDPLKMIVDLGPQLFETLEVMQGAGSSVDEAATGVRDLTATVQTAFQDEGSDFKALMGDVRQLSVKAQAALDNFNRMFNSVNDVVGDPALKGQIKTALAEFPKILQEIRLMITDTRATVNEFGTIPKEVKKTIGNIEIFTDALKKQGPEVVSQINSSLKNIDTLVDDLKQFSETISKIDLESGSAGKFFGDTELYDSVMRTARNIEEVSNKLEPFANDLRMVGDTLARDPGSVLRGALKPGSANYKGSAGRDGGIMNKRR